jgi:hypothetical protein
VSAKAFLTTMSSLCFFLLATALAQAQAAPSVLPKVPPPASGFAAPSKITIARREERLVPPMPIPHAARTATRPAAASSPPLPRPRPPELAPRKAAADAPRGDTSEAKSSEEPGTASAVKSGVSLVAPSPAPVRPSKAPALVPINGLTVFASFAQLGWKSGEPGIHSHETCSSIVGILFRYDSVYGCQVRAFGARRNGAHSFARCGMTSVRNSSSERSASTSDIVPRNM